MPNHLVNQRHLLEALRAYHAAIHAYASIGPTKHSHSNPLYLRYANHRLYMINRLHKSNADPETIDLWRDALDEAITLEAKAFTHNSTSKHK